MDSAELYRNLGLYNSTLHVNASKTHCQKILLSNERDCINSNINSMCKISFMIDNHKQS